MSEFFQEAMAQIKLPEEMIKNFALFLMQVEEDGELSGTYIFWDRHGTVLFSRKISL